MRFRFIERNTPRYSVAELCRNLTVSKAGYYAWRERGAADRARVDVGAAQEIAAVHHKSRGVYGSRRIVAEMRANGMPIGRKRVVRLMRRLGLSGKKRPKRRHRHLTPATYPAAPNLVNRQFRPPWYNLVWVADTTQIATKEGWLYLTVVLDLFARRVVGWSMGSLIDSATAIAAVEMALARRCYPANIILHSDRGSQFASREFRAFLASHNITPSMSRKGDCWDNAVMESFFATLKTELDCIVWPSRDAVRIAVFDWIETWYNPFRRHSTNAYASPIAAERRACVC